jgi:hypothetical protein
MIIENKSMGQTTMKQYSTAYPSPDYEEYGTNLYE